MSLCTTLLLGTVHHPTHPAHTCLRVCVFVLTVVPVAAENRQNHRWQLAFGRQGREGERKEGREHGWKVRELMRYQRIPA